MNFEDRDYKLVAFDMDGTLLNSDKQIAKSSIDAINQAIAAGKIVTLSTGRCIPELDYYFDDLPGVRYLVCSSGAMVYDRETERFVYKNTVPEKTVEDLLEIASLEDDMPQILGVKAYINEAMMTRLADYGMGIYQESYERAMTLVDDIPTFYKKNKPLAGKVNFYHRTPEGREKTRARIVEKGLPVELANAEITSLECSAKGVTKGSGLMALCKHLGIDIADTIAVGDADNDLNILQTAGLPVAMGNANENVKKVCKAVVADCDHDGCAEVIYKYLLKNKY